MNEEYEEARADLPEPTEPTERRPGRDDTALARVKAADALQIALDRRDNGGPRSNPSEI